jgi:hypothetical protein
VTPLALAAALFAAPTGNAGIDALFADLTAGRRAEALERVVGITSITDQVNAVETPAAFVDKMLQCGFVSMEEARLRETIYSLTVRCPDGDYVLFVDPQSRAPRLIVAQFVTRAAFDIWRDQLLAMIRPAPPAEARPDR